ncbi:hypothetical protein SALWKB2_2029 [Snodgrassella alvi wkB2]|nr:hypothetical protein SALWKB2_2029 [Snodgrassella alvi wkB2]
MDLTLGKPLSLFIPEDYFLSRLSADTAVKISRYFTAE